MFSTQLAIKASVQVLQKLVPSAEAGRGFSFPPINTILRWKDVTPGINKVVIIAILSALIGTVLFLVAASKDAGKDSVGVTREVVSAAAAKLGVQAGDIESGAVRVVRKSFDARRVRRTGLQEPHFNYVLDIELGAKGKVVKLKAEPGKFERATGDELFALTDDAHPHPAFTSQRPVAVVGSGPAGTCLHIYTCI